ncbi:MAG: aldehyde dehydrogenase family protein [Alphaproteobacteria bacterium]|nr:aldehyde dehydrogenase family protein [Alphaproteobacteria bacterium]
MNIAAILDSMDYGPAPESAGVAEAWLARHDQQFRLFIGGKWVKPSTGKSFATVNPASGKTLAQIALAGEGDVDAAVTAARKALPGWTRLGGHGRARVLYALARMVQRHARLLAVVETLDNGKPIRETRDIDLPLVARHFYHHAGWAQLRDAEFPGHRPLGVVGQIVPWNFPLLMLAWKVAPALAAGNTVVLKPAEDTSLSALLFAELAAEAGLPAGALNIVTGAGEVGETIVRHAGIDKIAFTGSTEVGRSIRAATAGSGKKLTLELGGKSPFIVFDDADLDAAVEGAVDSIWFNQGQVCCAGSRLLVHEGTAERLYVKLKTRMDTLRMGDPLDKCTDIGAVVSPRQRQRIESLVERGVAEGATLWRSETPPPGTGCYYPPTLLTGVSPAAEVAQVEIFGPVLAAMTFRTPEEAVTLANNSRYGLAACVWTENVNLALDVAPKLKAGTVWINCANQFDAACGFGGYRESGFGREGGREGMYEYLAPDLPAYAPPKPRALRLKAPPAAIDRTAKLHVGGKQARPDSGYSRLVPGGEVGEGNRKDIRNAVEAARKADAWTKATAHNRAQVLYYLAENLSARADEFVRRLCQVAGSSKAEAKREVETSLARLFTWGAWADKFDGQVHNPPLRGVALAMPEALGVIGAICPDDMPLLSFVSIWAPALAMGNRVVAVPSQRCPLPATDFYQVIDTSDVPPGALAIVTGERRGLAETLAAHGDVDAVWCLAGDAEAARRVEAASAADLKRSWVDHGRARDWRDPRQGEGTEFLRQATQVKNVWIPYGE